MTIGLEPKSPWPQPHALATLPPTCFPAAFLPRTPSACHFSPPSELPICPSIPPHPPARSLLYLLDFSFGQNFLPLPRAAAHNYVSLAGNFVSLFTFLPRFESFFQKRLWVCLGQNPFLTHTFPWVHWVDPLTGWGALESDKDDLIWRLTYFTECLGYLKKLTIKLHLKLTQPCKSTMLQ